MNEQSDNFFIHLGGMSALFALMRDGKVSATAFVVGAALCSFADRDGVCWPRREDIGKRVGIPRTATISASLSELLHAGFMERVRLQRGVKYRLHLTPTYTTIASDVAESATSGNLQRSGFRYIGNPGVSESATLGRSDVVETATPEMQSGNPDVAHVRTSSVAETATLITYNQSNNETNNETTKETSSPKPKKGVSPEITEAAARIVVLYAASVKPKSLDKSGSRKVFLSTATRLLTAGFSEADLSRAIRNYAAAAAKTERGSDDVKFRYGFQTFFGPKNEHWRDHLDTDTDAEAVTLPIRNSAEMLDPRAEYEMPQADVDLIIAWEKEQARKVAANV